MALLLTYYSPAIPSRGVAGWSEDLVDPHFVRLGDFQGVVAEAQLGAVGISSVRIDDPDGQAGHLADGITGLKQMAITESLAPTGNHRIWTGYIGKRQYARGQSSTSGSMITGAARTIDIDLVDLNSFLTFRVFKAPDDDDANRPAETDVARITWMLAKSYLSTILFDNGLVSSANPTDLDATDFRGQHPTDILNDAAQQSGKNFFVYYDEANGQFSLFYDKNDSLVYLADPFAVSNVLGDVPVNVHGEQIGPTWAPYIDATLDKDPARVVAGVYLPNGSNTAVYRSMPTTADTYGWRDVVSPVANLKTTALIQARGDRVLLENSTEDETLTFTLSLPAANVNDCHEGQSFMARFSHLPGYDPAKRVRVMKRQVSMKEPTDERYQVQFECTPMKSPPQSAWAHYESGYLVFATPTLVKPTTPGNLLVAMTMARGNIGATYINEPTFTDNFGSPPLAQTWTRQAWQASFDKTQYPGGSTLGVAFGIYSRLVAPGEATLTPTVVSLGGDPTQAVTVYLWELAQPVTLGAVTTLGQAFTGNIPIPPSVSFGSIVTPGTHVAVGSTLAGFVLGGFVTGIESYGDGPLVTLITGTQLENVSATRLPFSDVNHCVPPWVYLAKLATGGIVEAVVANSIGPTYPTAYNHFPVAGASIVINGISDITSPP